MENNDNKFKIKKGNYYICIRNLDDDYGTRAFRKGDMYYSTKDETLILDNSNVPYEIKYCVEDYFRPWSFKFVRRGDFLCYNDGKRKYLFIVRNVMGDLFDVDFWYDVTKDTAIVYERINQSFRYDSNSITLVSEKDRKLLTDKLREVGYEWENGLKKIKTLDNKRVEPKFHEGDWIIFNGLVLYINEIVNGYYRTISIGGIHRSYDWDIDNVARLWAIQDAKDGDILCVKYGNDEMPFIFTGKQDDAAAYCALNSFGEFVLSIAGWLLKISVLPATKEQQDLLFQKMHKAGWSWNAETKELSRAKEIISEQGKCSPYNGVSFEYNGHTWGMCARDYGVDILCDKHLIGHLGNEQIIDNTAKTCNAWSGEDDYNLQCMIAKAVSDIHNGNVGRNQELIDWLESLKQRMQRHMK